MFRNKAAEQFDHDPVLVPQSDGRHWKLYEEFSYETDAGNMINIPEGFLTDLASTPRLIWWLYPPFGRYLKAAIVHDWLYSEHRRRHGHFSRAYADAILLEAMRDCGVGRITAGIIWSGVRVGGWAAWMQKERSASCVA